MQVILLLIIQGRITHQCGHSHHAIERRANFMAHRGQECGFGFRRLQRLLARGCQLARAKFNAIF